MLKIRIISTPQNMEKLATNGPAVVSALMKRMDLIDLMLQSKIVGEEIPTFFPHGASNIPATVRAIPSRLEGTKIVGNVEAGGPRTTKQTLRSGALVDYAAVQEYGVDHPYEILPFNKKALAFLMGGNRVVVRSVLHPGLRERPYMRAGLANMEEQIIAELQAEVQRLLA